jgi:hypothetical protein
MKVMAKTTGRKGAATPTKKLAEPTAVEAEGEAIGAGMTSEMTAELTEDQRARMVAEQAYLLAQQRGFTPGGELADWLAAERIIAERLIQHR